VTNIRVGAPCSKHFIKMRGRPTLFMFRKLGRKLPLAMQFAENAEGSRTLGRPRRSEIGDLKIQNRQG